MILLKKQCVLGLSLISSRLSNPIIYTMLELIRKPQNYVLSKDNDVLTLSVSCGASDLDEVNYLLDSGEIYQYESQGEPYLDGLAQKIRDNPAAFRR